MHAMHAALRNMFSCCLSPGGTSSSDQGSDDEIFTTIGHHGEHMEASSLYAPGVCETVTALLAEGDAAAAHAPTTATAAATEPPESGREPAATVSAIVTLSEGRSDSLSSDDSMRMTVWRYAMQRRPAPCELSVIHRCSTLEGRSAAGPHSVSLGVLLQLAARRHPGGSDNGSQSAISKRAASLAHHIAAAPEASSSFSLNGPASRNGPARAASSKACAQLFMARWASLLTTAPTSSPATASAATFPVSSAPKTTTTSSGSRTSSTSELRVISLPAGAAAYIMRAKAQRADDSNTLVSRDFDFLMSAASSRSGRSETAAGW